MPIIFLYFFRLDRAGGAERMLCGLANDLAQAGCAVHVVSWDPPGSVPCYPLDGRVSRHALGFRPGVADKLRRTRALAKVLRAAGAEVLIGFVMSGDKTVYAAAKLAGVRLVAAERNSPSMYWWRYSALQRWQCFALLHLVDRIVVQFPEFARRYPASLHRRIEAIGNPVTAAGRRAGPAGARPQGRCTLLAVSRLDEIQKRLRCLIDAFAEVAPRHPAWDLEIIGDGPDRACVEQRIVEHRLGDRVRILPSRADVFAAYAESQLFVMPSCWEGFPNALAEAMAHGLPAVGFAGADGVSHLIADGETGWLATGVDDPPSLAAALDATMADGGERARRGERAAQAMASFAPERQYAKWRALIGELLGTSIPATGGFEVGTAAHPAPTGLPEGRTDPT